ncbi:TRAP transporter large permease subunit [Salinarimonas sp.]|uniref:TRAP transporter large permease n=1 Tax=Salinarimonas sp. TaxID=2766526 RepID=UPI00391CE54B
MAQNLDILLFAALCGAILIGFPVAFTLAGVAVVFAYLGYAMGAFDPGLFRALAQRIFGIMTNQTLIAIPLFVAMGVILEKSKLAEDLLVEMGRLFGHLRGGLPVSVMSVGALLAASTGIVGATVVAMALIALPAMLKNRYDAAFSAGTVCTAGTLGQIIPPSTMLIILSEVMSSAYQQAQFRMGRFSVETISVGETFAAALLPGLMLVVLYLAYILLRAQLQPSIAPAMPREADVPIEWGRVVAVLVMPIALIVAVLGSILGGIATPTEAAAVGAIGALLLAAIKLSKPGRRLPFYVGIGALLALVVLVSNVTIRPQRSDATAFDLALAGVAAALALVALGGILLAIVRLSRAGVVREIATGSTTVTAMIFATLIGATIFTLVFRGLGGDLRVEAILDAMPGGAQGALLFTMVVIFLLGFFLDFVEISVIILPIVAPALLLMGLDPIWLSVLIAINLQTSFLTPPFGFSLFYLRGAAPPEISTMAIYRGVAPYIGLQAVAIAIVWFVPAIATALPGALFR